MLPEAAQSAEWLVQLATSALFLVPGYLVVRFLQTTRETRSVDTLELTLQSLTFSLLICAAWFYCTPPGVALRQHLLVQGFSGLAQKAAVGRLAFWGLAWLALLTVITGGIAAIFRRQQWYWRALAKIGFDRLSPFITTWEEISDLSAGSWVSVETEHATYLGIINSVTPHPHERSVILMRAPKYPMRVLIDGKIESISAGYIWLSGDAIRTIGVFHQPKT